jgi:hypothetical protein
MTYIAIALALALIVQQWQHHRHRMEWERVMRLERMNLLNRIQAPELAVLPENPEPAPYVAPDDDAGYWAAQEDREAS